MPLVIFAGMVAVGVVARLGGEGTLLLGVRVVIAESERIHRSNLVGMGVLPLEFVNGETRESLGITGHEEFSIEGISALKARAKFPRARARRSRREDI